jgi:hypothetical protein
MARARVRQVNLIQINFNHRKKSAQCHAARQNLAEACETLVEHIPEEKITATLYSYIFEWLHRGWIASANWKS